MWGTTVTPFGHGRVKSGSRWRWEISLTHLLLCSKERAPCTHWTEDWVGPKCW